ncbi:Circularly permuted ATPgrasp domain containing protein [Flavobacteriaceae bacterium]|jgi:uncharacterized circularly permuted ATP-grasp superfamily protein
MLTSNKVSMVENYVPDMIKYYLNEEPILKNVPTYQMENKEERELVFADKKIWQLKKPMEVAVTE